jgi:nucleotide-binding universal stress UspA family protein
MLQLLLNRHAYDTSPQHPGTTVGDGTTFVERGTTAVEKSTTSVEKGTTSGHTARPWEATMNQRVLVVVDPEGDQRLLLWLRRVLGGPPADLHLLSVLRPVSGVVAGERRVAYAHQAEEAARAHTLARLSPAAARLKDEGFRVKTEVRFGDPEATVLRTAAELGASLIVLAVREGRGWRVWRAGRVEHRILRRATVPVLAVQRHGQSVA